MLSSERLALRDAAAWFARMKGPDAATCQAEFEAWLGNDQLHRTAYSRVAETYSLGKNLDRSEYRASRRKQHPTKWKRLGRPAMLACLAALVATPLAFWLRPAPETGTGHRPVMAYKFATRMGEIRAVKLGDGSVVTLDTDTHLGVTFGSERRELWLEQGRARFDVTHDGRTFIVHAGGGTVIARGTLFDVRVDSGRATVRLLRGAIDVNLPTKTSGEPRVRTVQPGQAVAFDDVRGIVALAPAQRTEIVQTTWPDALLDFDNVTVRDFVAEANRYAEKRLVVSDPALAARRISGTFRVGDPGRLAGHISVLLDAEVRQSPNGDFILVGRSR